MKLLKESAVALAKPLTLLMNRSLAEGAIPSDWKHASVTPIHKAGAITDAANYRPISTLPVFAKILEHAVHIMVYTSRQLAFVYLSVWLSTTAFHKHLPH